MKRLIPILIVILWAASARAEVLMDIKTEYYPVDGVGKRAILADIKRKAPLEQHGKKYPAYTKTELKYRYTWGKDHGRCKVVASKIFLNITYIYPKPTQSQPYEITQWWRLTMARYIEHEEIHGAISKHYAKKLDQTLLGLTDLECSTAKQIIQQRAHYVVRKMKDKQIEYDRITHHGQKQHRWKGIQ